MSRTAAARAVASLRSVFGVDAEVIVRAPGRVNLIGEHVDSNGELVLPVAIDRDIAVVASNRWTLWW